MKDYTPPGGNDKKPAAKKKPKKDKNAPKKGMSAFMFFSQKMRPKIKAENPDISFGDIGKKMGELYKKLTPEERAPYDQMALEDKERAATEMAEYNKDQKKKAQDDGVDDSDDDDDDSDSDDESD